MIIECEYKVKLGYPLFGYQIDFSLSGARDSGIGTIGYTHNMPIELFERLFSVVILKLEHNGKFVTIVERVSPPVVVPQ